MLNNRKPSRVQHWDAQTATSLLRNDRGGIAAHADYDRDDYIYPRVQPRAMQMMEWENRLKPIRHWGSNVVANLAWQIFA